MPKASKERQDLAKADLHIAEGEAHVRDLVALIERMIEKGYDTIEAERLLQTFEDTLKLYRVHRELILDEIAHQEGPET